MIIQNLNLQYFLKDLLLSKPVNEIVEMNAIFFINNKRFGKFEGINNQGGFIFKKNNKTLVVDKKHVNKIFCVDTPEIKKVFLKDLLKTNTIHIIVFF